MVRMRHRATAAVIAALAAAAAIASGSCRGVVVGDRVDVANELCTILADCYPDDAVCASLGDGIPAATWQSFLEGFSSECLSSCAQARACADHPPFCGGGVIDA